MSKLQRIVVAIDLSPASSAALRHAAVLAHQLGATVDFLHIARPREHLGEDDVATLFRGTPGSTLEADTEKDIQRELTSLVNGCGFDRLVRNDEIEQGRDVAKRLVELVRERRYDLLVMGTNAKGTFEKLISPSVVHKVVATSPCPVVTCRVAE